MAWGLRPLTGMDQPARAQFSRTDQRAADFLKHNLDAAPVSFHVIKQYAARGRGTA